MDLVIRVSPVAWLCTILITQSVLDGCWPTWMWCIVMCSSYAVCSVGMCSIELCFMCVGFCTRLNSVLCVQGSVPDRTLFYVCRVLYSIELCFMCAGFCTRLNSVLCV